MSAKPSLTLLRPAQWRVAAQVLQGVWFEQRVADASLQQQFRERREMGGRDRALVTQLVYGVLRDAMRLRELAGALDRVEPLMALHLLEQGGFEVEALQRLGCADAAVWQARLAQAPALSEAAHANVPEPIWQAWCQQYGADDARSLAAALNQEAPVDLRVNTLKTSRDAALAALRDAGIEAEAGRLAPQALRLSRRIALQAQAIYREGWVEPQDQGSQLLALMVQAQAGERVADFCAGAGGKTLAIAAQMQGSGELWALDVDAARLQRLRPRAERAGLPNLHLQHLPDPDWRQRHAGSFDAVLVDAPCSGTGTWRRNPELRLRDPDWAALADLQRSILRDAAGLLRPGGRLVYATCSLMAAENEAVVSKFLSENKAFVPQEALPPPLQALATRPGQLNLRPDRQGCDGFFAAALQRRV